MIQSSRSDAEDLFQAVEFPLFEKCIRLGQLVRELERRLVLTDRLVEQRSGALRMSGHRVRTLVGRLEAKERLARCFKEPRRRLPRCRAQLLRSGPVCATQACREPGRV